MRKRRYFTLRRFRCPVCGAIITATKLRRRTGEGHVKTMYCYRCAAERDLIQIEVDKAR